MTTNKSKIRRALKELDGHKARGRYVEWLTLAAETGLFGPNDLETNRYVANSSNQPMPQEVALGSL